MEIKDLEHYNEIDSNEKEMSAAVSAVREVKGGSGIYDGSVDINLGTNSTGVVLCENSTFNGVVALGCTPVSLNL